jgi:pyruvate,water dikinase
MAEQAPILPPGPPEFPFEWQEPDDAELSWEWDNMHGPTPLAPLAADYMLSIQSGFSYRYQTLGIPMEILCRIWNGYPYFAARFGGPEDEVMAGALAGRRSRITLTAAYWERTQPELLAIYEAMDAIDPDSMGSDALAEAWHASWRGLDRAWRIHFLLIAGPYQVLEDLADRYERLVPDAAAGDAMRLIQGGVHDLQDVGDGLERLVVLARRDPAIGDRLRAGDLEHLPSDGPFAQELADFLARHGHLGQGWDDLQLASWAEEPQRLLADIGKQLDQPKESADDRRARLADDAHRLLEGLRSLASDRTDELAEFESVLASAREIGHITETHNYWIDRMAQAHIRRLTMRVAHRLVDEGVIGEVDDVFYLTRAEIGERVREPGDMRQAIVARREEHERQRGITPPPWVGQPPEGGGGRFDAPERDRADTDHEIRGAGASAGIVRGPARVTLGQEDFDRIQAGDVIVCPSSNPSWVPLFSLAAGLVTDTGGVLSHAAVVAREFGLPAVVGTRDGTTRIADGRMVELDGTTGIVRLL